MGGKTKSRRKAGSAAKPRAAKKTAAKSKSTKKKPSKPTKAMPKASKPKRAPAKKPKRAATEPTVIESLVGATTDGVPEEDFDDKPTGPIKRFTRGVGKFFAKMTGRDKQDAEVEDVTGDEPSPDRTIELQAEDILQPIESVASPKARGRKKPPPPPT